MWRRCILLAAVPLAGCAEHVSGIVQDASTGRPIEGATVELSNRGWGKRNGQVVWDAEKVTRTTTDAQGRFGFDQDGGVGLRIHAAPEVQVEASLCPRSPMLVRVGGPWPGLRADQRLIVDADGAIADAGPGTDRKDLGIRVTSGATGDEPNHRVEARGGIRFIEGTGAIPAPPPLPYDRTADIDQRSTCGWLFVSDGTSPIAIIRAGTIGWEQDPGGPQRGVMLYTPLPNRG